MEKYEYKAHRQSEDWAQRNAVLMCKQEITLEPYTKSTDFEYNYKIYEYNVSAALLMSQSL